MVRSLDMDVYPRRAHFDYFRAMANPYVGVTVPVDVTDFLARTRRLGRPFSLSFLYHAAGAANAVTELRQRIAGDRIIEFDACRTSHTVARPDGTYCYCELDCTLPLEEFLPYAAARQQAALRANSLEDGADAQALFFVSCLPWLAYTALLQPTPSPADSNPRITFGRYVREGERVRMPVSLLCHHALVDGRHLANFYEQLACRLAQGDGR